MVVCVRRDEDIAPYGSRLILMSADGCLCAARCGHRALRWRGWFGFVVGRGVFTAPLVGDIAFSCAFFFVFRYGACGAGSVVQPCWGCLASVYFQAISGIYTTLRCRGILCMPRHYRRYFMVAARHISAAGHMAAEVEWNKES